METSNQPVFENLTQKPNLNLFLKEENLRMMSLDSEAQMDNMIQEISNYLTGNNSHKTQESADAAYAEAADRINQLKKGLSEVKFEFYLNRAQWKFLTDLLISKMEYDVNTIFIAIELTDMLGGMNDMKYKDDKTFLSTQVNQIEITYIYHLISTHKAKGLSKQTYLFADVLRRIGEISKVLKYYENRMKEVDNTFLEWSTTLDKDVVLNQKTESIS